MRLLILLTIFLELADSANILAIFPLPSASHDAVYRALTDALEERGHTLTIITSSPRKSRSNSQRVVEIDLSFMHQVIGQLMDSKKWTDSSVDEVAMLGLWTDVFDSYFDGQFNHPTIREMIKMKDKFVYDVIIVEFMNQVPWQAFALLFNAPIIGISAFDMMHTYHHEHGNVINPILHPDFVFPFHGAELTFMQRARVFRFYAWYHLWYKRIYNQQFDNIIKRHMGTLSLPTDALDSIAEVLLINTHPALGHIRPVLPTTVQLGFMHIKEPRELTDDRIRSFLASSNKPIIYMSLESTPKSSQISTSAVEIFKMAFASLEDEFDVMWRWEQDEMENQPRNVLIGQRFEQADLLAHKRVKVFITRGDHQSMEEAIDRAVPLIAIPFAADQHYNAQRISELRIGVTLALPTLTKDSLVSAIREVVTNANFTDSVTKLRELVRDEPLKPVERAVWWVEYVTRHGGTLHLDYKGRHVPFWKYLMLDFIAIGVVIWHVLIKFVKFTLRKMFGGKRKAKKGKTE